MVGVTWYEALAFCRWLTEASRSAGVLPDDFHLLTGAAVRASMMNSPVMYDMNYLETPTFWAVEWPIEIDLNPCNASATLFLVKSLSGLVAPSADWWVPLVGTVVRAG